MKFRWKQWVGLVAAGVAAACCLGLPAILAVLGAVGLGFIVHDAYLFPIFVAAVLVTLWFLYGSAKRRGKLAPFRMAAAGGAVGGLGLWLLVTGLYPLQPLLYAGLALLLGGTVWDAVSRHNTAHCDVKPDVPESPRTGATPGTPLRAVAGSAIAAAAFYGLYKSVDAFSQGAEEGEIACWGINECKGQTACATAFNSCTAANECRGRGYVFVPGKECADRGGEPLAGSEGDPKKK